jgi:hypothetical protein
MVPIEIIGYNGLMAGVASQELAEGMLVVVDGSERLRNGQAIAFSEVTSGN